MCCNSWTSELGLDWTSELLGEGRVDGAEVAALLRPKDECMLC
jgi:hypothetical protein